MKDVTFEQFWNLYGLKRDKIAAERAWKRLSAKDRRAAVDGIKPYREDCANHNRMMMYAQGYLNHRRWEDDFSAPVENENQELQRPSIPSAAPSPLPIGCRTANEQEQQTLQSFRQALLSKEPAKPYQWHEFQKLVAAITIPYVTEQTGVIHMAVLISGKPERITEFMIDYYDSYADFYRLLTLHFDVNHITFNI